MSLISHKELTEIIESFPTESRLYVLAEHLVAAMSDWPTINLKEPTDLIKELRDEIKSNLTYENLVKFAESLQPERDAWKMESVASLLEMFDHSGIKKTLEIDAIIEKMQLDHTQINREH